MIWHGCHENAGIFEDVCQNLFEGEVFVVSLSEIRKKRLIPLWFSCVCILPF